MNILLVEPEFPIPPKSKNHQNFLPIGLLKLASYYRQNGHKTKLVRGNKPVRLQADEIKITSLFTYWSKYVWDSVAYYRKLFPKAKISVGGIYASLMPEHCKQSGCDEVFFGVHKEAEKCKPAYDLIDVDYQIVHASRGCIRRCQFCGTWRIEPTFECKQSIKDEICSNKLVFYDNNMLANPHIKNILKEIVEFRYKGKPIICESQSGFDGRLLTPEFAKLIKAARFQNPRLAWDWGYDQRESIKKQIDLFVKAGYKPKDIFVFMIYNWELSSEEMEKKRLQCKKWGVQIADCRNRPLYQTFDNYNPRKGKTGQTDKEYYIHPKWTDAQIRQFRKNVREQNIGIRFGTEYTRDLERGNSENLKQPNLFL
jgi:hypothetical protein